MSIFKRAQALVAVIAITAALGGCNNQSSGGGSASGGGGKGPGAKAAWEMLPSGMVVAGSFDFAGVMKGPWGPELKKGLEQAKSDPKAKDTLELLEAMGIDLTKGVRQVAFGATGSDSSNSDGLMIVDSDADLNKGVEAVQAKLEKDGNSFEAGFEKATVGGVEGWKVTFTPKRKPESMFLAQSGTFIYFAQTEDILAKSQAAAKDSSKSLGGDKAFAGYLSGAGVDTGSVFWLASPDTKGEIPKTEAFALAVALGDPSGLALSVTMDNSNEPAQFAAQAAGFKMMAKQQAAGMLPSAAKIIDSIEVSANGKTLNVSLEASKADWDKVAKEIEAMAPMLQAMAGM